jgi:oligopeptide/dipeptide ABC transporter ATP-binding protein
MAGSGTAHLRPAETTLVRVEDLVVEFPIGNTGERVHAVSGISIDLIEGETLGLVGESGCGKSTTGRAMMQVPPPTSGSVTLDGVELTALDSESLRHTRSVLQMIFQDPISALNPRRTVPDIISEPLVIWWEDDEGRPPISVWFEQLGKIFQRVGNLLLTPLTWTLWPLSLAFVLWVVSEAAENHRFESQLEWTEIRAQIIGFPALAVTAAMLLVPLSLGVGWLLLAMMVPFGMVSKVLGSVSGAKGVSGAAFATAVSAFMVWRTWASLPGVPGWLVRWTMMIIVSVAAIWLLASLREPSRAGASGVAAALAALIGLELFYIAGLDGKPKLVVLIAATAANYFIYRLAKKQMAAHRQELLARAEPKVRQMLETVGIDPDRALDRRPDEFSGGQAQRLSIARALIMEPQVMICDEPVSTLDVSVQAQILNLLEEMKERYRLSLIFIAHDLAVVKNVSDRVVVMYLGKTCEVAHPDVMYGQSAHPYTQLLLSAIPQPDPLIEPRAAEGASDLPSPIHPPSGCRFRTRCHLAQERCAAEEPMMREIAEEHYVACHFPLIGEIVQ